MQKYRVETKKGKFLGIIEGKRQFKKFKEDLHKYNKYLKDEDILLVKVKEGKKTEYTIYDNYDVYSEENMKRARETLIENMFFNADEADENDSDSITVTDNYGKEVKLTREEYSNFLTEEHIQEECNFLNSAWFDDEKLELASSSEGHVVAIADLGRWNGRYPGYKELDSLEDVIYSSCDYERLYIDSNGDLRKDERHHDGNNSILYRYWKEGTTEQQRENFLNKIYNGECTRADITRYTRKAGIRIANAYGWTVRGGENKYKK